VVLLLRAAGVETAIELSDVTVCDVVVESELTEADAVNDTVCGEVVGRAWMLEVSETAVMVVAVAVGPWLTMSTMRIVFVTMRVSVRRSVAGGEAT
jgi:hypothetical protein